MIEMQMQAVDHAMSADPSGCSAPARMKPAMQASPRIVEITFFMLVTSY